MTPVVELNRVQRLVGRSMTQPQVLYADHLRATRASSHTSTAGPLTLSRRLYHSHFHYGAAVTPAPLALSTPA